MLTTTVAGRTWNFSHAIGRNSGLGNGFTQPNAIALASGGVLYVSSRGGEGAVGVLFPNKRIGKLTMDEEFIGDFGKGEPSGPRASLSRRMETSTAPTNISTRYSFSTPTVRSWTSGARLAQRQARSTGHRE